MVARRAFPFFSPFSTEGVAKGGEITTISPSTSRPGWADREESSAPRLVDRIHSGRVDGKDARGHGSRLRRSTDQES